VQIEKPTPSKGSFFTQGLFGVGFFSLMGELRKGTAIIPGKTETSSTYKNARFGEREMLKRGRELLELEQGARKQPASKMAPFSSSLYEKYRQEKSHSERRELLWGAENT